MTTQNVFDDRKWCAKCDRRLHVREFAPNAKLRSGLDSWCRSCHRAATRAWRARRAAQRAQEYGLANPHPEPEVWAKRAAA